MVQQLKERYELYRQQARSAREEAPALGGFLGFGQDPRKDPCHTAFFRDIEKWVRDFVASEPDEAAVCQAARHILFAPTTCRGSDAYWFMFAAHGLCKDLIVLLNPQDCAALAAEYDREFPRRDRLDAQADIYKRLVKGAKRK